jgi:hypothetical protein
MTFINALHNFDPQISLQRLMFAQFAQHHVHMTCGCMWKTAKNVTAKTIARARR